MRAELFVRLLGSAIFGGVGWVVCQLVSALEELPWLAIIPFAGVVLGFIAIPYLTTRPWKWTAERLREVPAHTFLAAVIGLVISLFIAALLALPLSLAPGWWGKALPAIVAAVLICLGISLMVLRGRDVWQSVTHLPILPPPSREGGSEQVILDTNAIIDGRIADISETGFLQGTLLIPRFVLDELHHIADSPDPLRRNRGRRGLDMLTRLQRESEVPVQVIDVDFSDVREVDAKLVRLAKSLRSPIVSNDFNLNRVAEIQGVRVLNINELANAIKPVVLPGEEMRLRIIQEGKEAGQGVGFLDDGTMVVVEAGRRYLNQELDVVITRVLQTAAGRMIFAHPKESGNERKR